jgi:formamidopyrimidine-DNA glycosylase
MPELPEVETMRRNVFRVLKGKRLVEVVPDPDDRIVFDVASPEEVREALEGAKVIGSGRKGKYFWLELDRRPWPVFHFGMTGNAEIRKKNSGFTKAWGRKQGSGGKRTAEEAKFVSFCRLRITAEDGMEVAFTDPRRFGRIRLANDPLREPPLSKLGYDPLLEFPKGKALVEILRKRRAPIKAVLLDQGLFAGVGNWIADEVLFQARIDPHRLASKLSPAEVGRLRVKLLAIIRKSVSLNADYDLYPKSWMFHYRWGKTKDASVGGRHKIVHDTIGGRTTAWVPRLQK